MTQKKKQNANKKKKAGKTAGAAKKHRPSGADKVGRSLSVEKIRTDRPGPLLCPVPAVMVICGDMTDSNIITIAWTGIVNSDPPMTYISVRKSRFSHSIIQSSGEFVINIVTEELARAADFCGVRSGADMDKFQKTGLTKAPADEVHAPMIAESPVNLECRVAEVIELPSHDMFLAEIVAVHISRDLADADGSYHFNRMSLVGYSHGFYYRVSKKPLGRFGFSVMKPKTAKRLRR